MEVVEKYFPNLSAEQLELFSKLKPLYEDWNSKINVISRKDIQEFNTRHLLHALAVTRFVKFKNGSKVTDIGTGGGIPGIPLAIYYPDVQFTLVDSIAKKIKVVQSIADELGLKNVRAFQSRFEKVKEPADFVVSRAVAQTTELLRLTRAMRHKHTKFVMLKGGDLKVEKNEVFKRYRNCRWKEFNISSVFEEEFFETKKVVLLDRV